MPQLKAYGVFGMFALLGVLFACTSEPNAAQLKPETLVGEFIFQMADRGDATS
jgi:hypothetical protein